MYWNKIRKEKHADLIYGLDAVQETLVLLDEAYRGVKDLDIVLYYKKMNRYNIGSGGKAFKQRGFHSDSLSNQSSQKERRKIMAKVKMFLDPVGNTLNVWWGEPKDAFISEEAELTNDVIVKNRKGVPIGVEIIGVFPRELNVTRYLKLKKTYPLLLEAPLP